MGIFIDDYTAAFSIPDFQKTLSVSFIKNTVGNRLKVKAWPRQPSWI